MAKDINPLISVLMPVYNEKRGFLTKSIESIISQDLKKFELVIVDDGSAVADPVVPETVAV